MKLKEFKQASHVTGLWSFLPWFLTTKEGHYVLIGIFLLLIIFMWFNPDTVVKFKIAFWNWILQGMK